MSSLKISQFLCLFMFAVYTIQALRHPSSTRAIIANVWAAALVVLIAFMPG